jgi:hypothetical protein
MSKSRHWYSSPVMAAAICPQLLGLPRAHPPPSARAVAGLRAPAARRWRGPASNSAKRRWQPGPGCRQGRHGHGRSRAAADLASVRQAPIPRRHVRRRVPTARWQQQPPAHTPADRMRSDGSCAGASRARPRHRWRLQTGLAGPRNRASGVSALAVPQALPGPPNRTHVRRDQAAAVGLA